MNLIKSSISLVSAWLASESSTEKFIRLIGTAGTDPHQIHLCYHNMPHPEKERMDVQSHLKNAIKTDDPAIIQTVVNLIGEGDINQHVNISVGNVIGYCHGMSFNLLDYALFEGSHEAALFFASHSKVRLTDAHLRSASYQTKPDLQNIILEKMGFGDCLPR